jgi:predicted RNA-binding Zn ribbon-like protein
MTPHHLDHVLNTLVELVNTGSPAAPVEKLPDVASFHNFISARIITEVEEPTAADIAPLHVVRSRLRAIITAPNEETKTRLVNDALASAMITPRLVEHDGLGQHFHYFPAYASLSEHLLADCAMAIALLISSGESTRLRVCSATGCSNVFVDSSRNRSRTYCDNKKCGNRLHAAAYRQRQRG